MADITAAMVKELRERTGSGMMECKKALTETNGDIEVAIELMRKTGQAKAEKKAGRTAAEGLVLILEADNNKAVVTEVNCETDFVTKNEDFVRFANDIAQHIMTSAPADLNALMASTLNGKAVDEVRKELIAKIGENINVRRFDQYQSNHHLGTYLHGTRIGVVIELEGGSKELARDLAMHVAASNPVCVDANQVSAELLEKERAIYSAQAAESGKPVDIVEKMVEGRMRKFLEEVTLVGQAFVKDPDTTIGKLLEKNKAKVIRFTRIELGEGIAKEETDFAAEVMATIG